MPKRTRNFTQLFQSVFSDFFVSQSILDETGATILDELGRLINDEGQNIPGQGHSAARFSGARTAIFPSTGGYNA